MDCKRKTWRLSALLTCTGLAMTQSWANDTAQRSPAGNSSEANVLAISAREVPPPESVKQSHADFVSAQEVVEESTPAATREGGESCADAVVIGSLPFNDTGDTRNNQDNLEQLSCNGPPEFNLRAEDVVYSYTPPGPAGTPQVIRITMCGTLSAGIGHDDTRLLVFEGNCNAGSEYACNDDAESGCPSTGTPSCPDTDVNCGRQAEISVLEVIGGTPYFIVADGWNGEAGTYAIRVELVPPGACCRQIGGEVCNAPNISAIDCLCLAEKFTAGAADCAAATACVEDPIPVGCPENTVFGPGFDDANGGTTVWIVSADDGSGSAYFDGFWEVTSPISFVSWWGFYHLVPGAITPGNCDKADMFTVTFYDDDCGAPGDVIAGPFTETAAVTDQPGFIMDVFTVQLPNSVSFSNGWVGISAAIDPANPDCRHRITGYVEINAPGETGDRRSTTLAGLVPGDMMMCLSAPANNGACCNDSTGVCNDNGGPGVPPASCPPPSRFSEGSTCAALDPACGQGACCGTDGSCTLTTQANCSGVVWRGGVACEFANCPPANDNCTSVSPVALPPAGLTFNGRTNGATEDAACEQLGSVVWEAFTTSSCQDIVVDYCGTSPAFGAAPLGQLMPACCATNQALLACDITTTSRSGACCIDDPPGYEGNYSVTFPRVPAGTWYYPVRGGGGATGDYVLNVSGTACSPAGSCLTCIGSPEGEAGCSGGNDTCATADAIACGASVCGTANSSDVDWYVVNAPAGTLNWTVRADFPVVVTILAGSLGCAANLEDLVLDTETGCVCQDTVASACVPAGTYYLRVQPQGGANLTCGSAAYTATVSCGAACTPVVGACCTRTGCTPNSSQQLCDSVNGHYNGDGTSCGPNTCPTLAANDECAGAIVIPTNFIGPDCSGGVCTYTLRRSQLSANPTDGTPTCAPAPHDASAWFQWTTPTGLGAAPISFNLCCNDGGEQGDTAAVAYIAGNSCATIAADPVAAQLPDGVNGSLPGCNDESLECGDQRAELCPNTRRGSLTYRFQVQIKDAGGADEEDEFTLIVRPVSCAALVCTTCATPVLCGGGTPDAEPAANCNVDAEDNFNSGCNPLSRTPPDPEAFSSPIACGQTVCGTAGYFNTTGGSATDRRRDTDWYLITLTEDTDITWTVNSQTEGAQALVVDVNDCENSVILLSAADLNAQNDPEGGCGALTLTGTLSAGRYAMFAAFFDPAPTATDGGLSNEAINCPQSYVASLACVPSAGDLATPADPCSSVPALPLISGEGRYSGLIGQAGQAANGESSCDGALDLGSCGDPLNNKDVYWKYTATCTGRVTFEVTSGPLPMVLSAHTTCPANCTTELPGGLGVSCTDFGGVGGPKLTLDVTNTTTYVIRLAGDTAGPYEFVVSDCITACAAGTGGTLSTAVARKNCDLNIDMPAGAPITSEPRQGAGGRGISRVVFTYTGGAPANNTIVINQDASCPSPPTYVAYTGTSVPTCVIGASTLDCTFAPALENARTYRFTVASGATTANVELRGLVGDVNSDGNVNAGDRSIVVAAWTGPGFTCVSDLDNSGSTNAGDRSIVVAAWTGGAATNCAP